MNALLLAPLLLAATSGGSIAEAEKLAAAAIEQSAGKPVEALVLARRALELSADFEPTAFVKSGRKGEIVEDAYLEARNGYRRHRAKLYDAFGRCLAAGARHPEAIRFLRRGFELDGSARFAASLARSLNALGRGREALDVLLRSRRASWDAEALALAEQAADAAGLPSVQVEVDRVRLGALPEGQRPEVRDGPFRLPERTRLSTGVVADLEQPGLMLVYNSDASCRSCSGDLELIKRAAGRDVRVLLSPPSAEQDHALRQAAQLYRYDWPVVVGGRIDRILGVPAPSLLVIARRGLLGAVLKPPFAALPEVLELLRAADLKETLPRAQWNRRLVERKPASPRPGLLEEGLAPAEDEPAPEAFSKALAAYRAGSFREALRLFDELGRKDDGYLLPPEARLNRALCLLGLGRREEARVLLLKTGDSRFQEDLDRALERAGTPARR
jgi:tetratricopeptide (TPR) repeat protein